MTKPKKNSTFRVTLFVDICEHGVIGFYATSDLPHKLSKKVAEKRRKRLWDQASEDVFCTSCRPNSSLALYELTADVAPPAHLKGKTKKLRVTASRSRHV